MATGRIDEQKGPLKEAAGALTGDTELKRGGRVEQTAGQTRPKGSRGLVPEGPLTRRAQARRRKERLRVALAAARNELELGECRQGPSYAAQATIWDWHLASGRVEWSDTLKVLFGYAERVTDAAWREDRIHPEDRDRVKLSLQRATIVNHGAAWTEEYRFRRADGCYATVKERAYIVPDDTGPCWVLGRITPASAGRLHASSRTAAASGALLNGGAPDAGPPPPPGRRLQDRPGLIRAERQPASS
jgi:PAS domain-containing protein